MNFQKKLANRFVFLFQVLFSYLRDLLTFLARFSRTCHLLRAQIIIVVLSTLLLIYSQVIDEYRALVDPVDTGNDWLPVLTAVSSIFTLLVCFPFTIWFTSRWLTNLDDNGERPVKRSVDAAYRAPKDAADTARLWMPRVLAIFPLIVVAIVTAFRGLGSCDNPLIVASAVSTVFTVGWLYVLTTRTRHHVFDFVEYYLKKDFRDLWRIFIGFLVIVVASNWYFNVSLSQALGIITFGVGFFIVVMVFATYLVRTYMRTGVPFMVLLGLWTGLLAWLNATNNHEVTLLSDGDMIDGGQKRVVLSKQPEIQEAFKKWVLHKASTESGSDKEGDSPVNEKIPVFIVAAAGGGIFAAQNAAFTLATLDDTLASEGCGAFSKHIFAVSGISGGSVGAALHTAVLNRQLNSDNRAEDCAGKDKLLVAKLYSILNENLLAPVIGNFVTLDYPQRFLPANLISFPDRATALEDAVLTAVRRHEPEAVSFLKDAASSHWAPDNGLPALVLNATELQTGRTVSSSPFKLHVAHHSKKGFPEKDATFREILAKAPAEDNIYMPPDSCDEDPQEFSDSEGLKKDRDLSLIQAAVMSARFPYASPPGSLTKLVSSKECYEEDEDKELLIAAETQYIDGGYVEASGIEKGLKIVKLLQEVIRSSCSAPQERIENEALCRVEINMIAIYLRTPELVSDKSYGLVLTPPIGLLTSWSQRSQSSKEAALDFFQQGGEQGSNLQGIGKFFEIDPNDSDKEIPLGWRLSEKSSTKLLNLICKDVITAGRLKEVVQVVSKSWTGDLSCNAKPDDG